MNSRFSLLRKSGLQLALAAGLGLTALAASAASSYDATPPGVDAVNVGMTQDEVQQAMGRVHHTSFRGSSGAVWTFTTNESDGPKMVTVTFDEAGKVAHVNEQDISAGREQ